MSNERIEVTNSVLDLTVRETVATRHAIAKLVGDVALGREQPTPEVLDAIIAAVLRASRWTPPERLRPPPPPIPITHDPEPPSLMQRLRGWTNNR